MNPGRPSPDDTDLELHISMAYLLRNRHFLVLDAVFLALGTAVAYCVRFESLAGLGEMIRQWPYLLLTVPLRIAILQSGGAYRVLWRHSASQEFLRLSGVAAVAGLANLILGGIVLGGLGLISGRVPLTVLVISGLFTVLVPTGMRLADRVIYLQMRRLHNGSASQDEAVRRPVLIAGAGEAGSLVAQELLRSGALMPAGFLDDDMTKRAHELAGVPVLGRLDELAEVARSTGATEVIIAMPHADGTAIRALADAARAATLEVRTVPGLVELATGEVSVTALRKLRIEDLLRREAVAVDSGVVGTLVQGKRIMVTGAGGSIGSELCRQIAAAEPHSIALLGHGENSIFEIHGELSRRFPKVRLISMIADVRDRSRLAALFADYKPQLVFHAAAHKHVPLMEANPSEAITNNILGTWHVAELSAQHAVERLVMISTDKAVCPTNVMGASKRVAEQLVQGLARDRGVNFSAVRFGNVLGSRGSVVPTFLRQIEAGGPLTLTHPEVRRYFMTIPEAVALVLQAALMGKGGEIFALDMGEAVRIVDLAEDLVRLSGLRVGSDIEIVFTGLRPGEKLYEEVFFEGDAVRATAHPKIRLTRSPELAARLWPVVQAMRGAVEDGAEPAALRRLLRRAVPEYRPAGQPRLTTEPSQEALTEVA